MYIQQQAQTQVMLVSDTDKEYVQRASLGTVEQTNNQRMTCSNITPWACSLVHLQHNQHSPSKALGIRGASYTSVGKWTSSWYQGQGSWPFQGSLCHKPSWLHGTEHSYQEGGQQRSLASGDT